MKKSSGKTDKAELDDLKRTEAELEKLLVGQEGLLSAEIRLSLIYDNVSDVIFVINVEPDDYFRFSSVNRRFLEVTGLSESQIVGKLATEVIPEPAHALVFGKYHEAMRNKRPAHWEEISIYPAGVKVGEVTVAPVFDMAGRCTQLVGTVHDITEHKHAEERIASQHAMLQAIINSPKDIVVFSLDKEYRYTAFNDKHRQEMKTHWEADIQIGMNMLDCLTIPEARDIAKVNMDRALRGESFSDVQRVPGQDLDYEFNWSPIWKGQEVAGFAVFIHDITERKRAAEALQDSEEKYRTVVENAAEAILIAQDGMLKFVNRTASEIAGYSEQELRSSPFLGFIHPDDRNMVGERYLKRLKGDASVPKYEFRLTRKDGDIKWVEISAVLVTWEEKPATLNFLNDITERKRAEEQIRLSLKEKETLLREIYHRTKNNMNVIGAMLSLKARSGGNEAVAPIFRDIEDKIQAMALVHQKLYESKDLFNIDFQVYVSDLAALLMKSRAISDTDVSLALEMDKIAVSIDVAIPCGMILTELISNTFKHAFPGRKKGEVRIGIGRLAGGEIEVAYADNGIGVPQGFDFRNQPTLGLQMIFMLGEHQLQGQVQFESGRGVACRIRFNEAIFRARFEP